MKKEIADKWVEALRSGEYKQQCAALANSDRTAHCCLGVLCELAIKDGVELPVEQMSYSTLFDDARVDLPLKVMKWTDMHTPYGCLGSVEHSLVAANDTGLSFEGIAKLIERHWEEL